MSDHVLVEFRLPDDMINELIASLDSSILDLEFILILEPNSVQTKDDGGFVITKRCFNECKDYIVVIIIRNDVSLIQ